MSAQVVDPCAGSGTITLEAAEAFDAHAIGGDCEENALAAATVNRAALVDVGGVGVCDIFKVR